MADEFRATLGWFSSLASQVSAHVVIAADGTLARCVDDSLIAWHARSPANETMLSAELVQPKIGDHITDEQLRTLGWWLRQMSAKYHFTLTLATLPEHKSIPAGIAEGKSDIGSDYSYDRLLPYID